MIEYSFGQLPGVVTSANDNAAGPHASVAVGVVHERVAEHSIVVGPGSGEIVGGVLSIVRVMVCVHVAVLLHSSVAR